MSWGIIRLPLLRSIACHAAAPWLIPLIADRQEFHLLGQLSMQHLQPFPQGGQPGTGAQGGHLQLGCARRGHRTCNRHARLEGGRRDVHGDLLRRTSDAVRLKARLARLHRSSRLRTVTRPRLSHPTQVWPGLLIFSFDLAGSAGVGRWHEIRGLASASGTGLLERAA